MKALTTLAAALALVAGMSIANAQSSMDKEKSMGTSAKVTGTGEFCAKTESGELNCQYASLSACQSAASGAECVANPQSGTTGSKK